MAIDPVSKAIITAALIATQYAITASQKFEGPRLSELAVTGADYGTVIPRVWGTRRIECTIFFSEDLKEVKRRRKTKGGKFNEYTYFGTWAVAVCDNEIEKITKIWFDKHLIYDNTGAGPQYPFSFTEDARQGKRILEAIRIYTGTDTQLPDPRMEATVNGLFGADSCPAYRGLSYIMFEEIPLEKFGNRIPLVTVEVSTGGEDVFPWDEVPGSAPDQIDVSFGNMRFTALSASSETIWSFKFDNWARVDLVSRAVTGRGTLPDDVGVGNHVGFDERDNELWVPIFAQNVLQHFSGPGFGMLENITTPGLCGQGAQFFNINGQKLIGIQGAWPIQRCMVYHAGFNEFVYNESGIGWEPSFYCRRGDQLWAFGFPGGNSTETDELHMLCVWGGPVGLDIVVTWPEEIFGLSVSPIGVLYLEDEDKWVVAARRSTTAYYCKIDPDTGFISQMYQPFEVSVFGMEQQFTHWRGTPTLWGDYNSPFSGVEIDLATLTEARIVEYGDWTGADPVTAPIHIPALGALLSQSGTTTSLLTLRYLDRGNGGPTTLKTICDDIAEAVGADQDCDFTAFAGVEIKGFSTTQGPAKSILEPLITLHDSDIRPHNFGVQGVVRGSASSVSLPTSRFVVNGSRYLVERASETDLPQRVDVTFADIDNDQQPNTATAIRRTADSQRTANINADNYAEDPTTMIQLVERYIRRRWYEQESYTFSLPRTYIALEPADVITFQLDDLSRVGRVQRMEVGANGVLSLQVTRDSPSIALLSDSSGAGADGQVPDVIFSPGPSELVLADIPLVVDADDTTVPFLYFGMSPLTTGGWPGGDVWSSDENVDVDFAPGFASVPSEQRATIGYVEGTMPDGIPEVFDYSTRLTVRLYNGTLNSVSKDDILNNQTVNMMLVGQELVQFQTATLQSNGSYILSGFIRGLRGTEYACQGHQANEYAMLIDSTIFKRQMGAGELNDTDYYRGVTSGRSVDSVATKTLTFTGAANKPYSPAHLTLIRDAGTNDWAISWVRRSRIAGTNFVGSNIPLGESTESYEVDILDSYGDVVRTITSTSPAVTYTEAQQIADFGSAQASIEVVVYQMSSIVGRGFPSQQAA